MCILHPTVSLYSVEDHLIPLWHLSSRYMAGREVYFKVGDGDVLISALLQRL